MPSEIKELQAKIKELKNEKEMIGTIILMEVNRIIRRSEFLLNEQKDRLISNIWDNWRDVNGQKTKNTQESSS